MRYPIPAAFVLILALTVACTSIGLAPAKSLSDRVAYAYGVNTGVRTAATNSLRAGTLSKPDGEYVLKVTDETRTLLDASRLALDGGDPRTAEGRLTLALNILDGLQAHLSKQVKP